MGTISRQNTVRVVFEAIMDGFRQRIQQGARSVLQIRDAGQQVRQSFREVNQEVNATNSTLEGIGQTVKKVVGLMIVNKAAKTLINLSTDWVNEYAKTQTVIGDMASLGYENSELLRQTAIDFSNKWAGTTREGFIAAAYSIKSGVSSLTDEGVAQFTELAGLTAKATKATVDEMTSLFATGYGIYRDLYSDDFEFGEAFASGISKGIQLFKTSGSQMGGYLSTLGASAAQAGAQLDEVISIGGTLQATMTGSEAATKYNSFLKNAVKAAGELGMKFTDNHNRLLPAVEIIEQIKSKYGQILDAKEQADLVKAFGDDEAIKFITNLYNKTEALKQSQKDVAHAINEGKDAVEAMASTMNRGMGEKIELINQRWANLKDEMGKQMEPGISPALDSVGNKLLELQNSADFSAMGQSVGELVGIVSEMFIEALDNADDFIGDLANGLKWLATHFDLVKNSVVFLTEAFVSFKIASAVAPMIYAIGGALGFFTTTTGGATAATWSFTAALRANPLGMIVTIVTLLIMGLIQLIKWIIKTNGGIEAFSKKFETAMNKAIIKFEEFKIKFLEGIQSIVKHIPLIGDTLNESLERSIKKSKDKINELNEKIQQSNLPATNSEEDVDVAEQQERTTDDEPTSPNGINLSIAEESASGNKERTIKDDIEDIADKYEDRIDLYESRAILAEKQNDKKGTKAHKDSLMSVLREQVADLLKLEGKVTGKDKNIVETAKNKLLSRIADIAEEIRGGINELVGSFNTPSGLTAMTNYEYLTSTSKVANSKYVNTNNIEVLFNVKDLGSLTPAQINSKLTAIAAQIGDTFSLSKDQLVYQGMNNVSRN